MYVGFENKPTLKEKKERLSDEIQTFQCAQNGLDKNNDKETVLLRIASHVSGRKTDLCNLLKKCEINLFNVKSKCDKDWREF